MDIGEITCRTDGDPPRCSLTVCSLLLTSRSGLQRREIPCGAAEGAAAGEGVGGVRPSPVYTEEVGMTEPLPNNTGAGGDSGTAQMWNRREISVRSSYDQLTG
jgi:hypothetical protein